MTSTNTVETIWNLKDNFTPALDKINARIDQLNAKIGDVSKQTVNSTKAVTGLGQSIKGIGSAIAGGFIVGKVIEFGKEVIKVTAEFEKFKAVLKNSLGGVGAENAFNLITSFAAKTPYQVAELTESFIKLTNNGFKPTEKQLRSIGDLAASLGKGFLQTTEAILDMQHGQSKRLEEIGVQVQKVGSQWKFTFREISTIVNDNAIDIANYVYSLGEIPGVLGTMGAISDTLGGQLSNLGDNWDLLLSKLGKTKNLKIAVGALNEFLRGLGAAVDKHNGENFVLPIDFDDIDQKRKQVQNLQDIMGKTDKNGNTELDRYDNLYQERKKNGKLSSPAKEKEFAGLQKKLGVAGVGVLNSDNSYERGSIVDKLSASVEQLRIAENTAALQTTLNKQQYLYHAETDTRGLQKGTPEYIQKMEYLKSQAEVLKPQLAKQDSVLSDVNPGKFIPVNDSSYFNTIKDTYHKNYFGNEIDENQRNWTQSGFNNLNTLITDKIKIENDTTAKEEKKENKSGNESNNSLDTLKALSKTVVQNIIIQKVVDGGVHINTETQEMAVEVFLQKMEEAMALSASQYARLSQVD